MIIFKVVRFKNFLATGNVWTEIQLNSEGNTLIVGKNGSGKSTLLDALTFVLFGKAFRKINKPSLINSVNLKDCLVEVEFDTNGKNYKIIRGIKPNIFEIYKDDQLLNQESGIDYQDHLEKYILKMNLKAFTQIVILGSASFVPFMQLVPADRRAVIEDLLDIQVFSVMNVLAKQRLQVVKEDTQINSTKLVSMYEKKNLISKTLDSLKQNTQAKFQEFVDKQKDYYNTIQELKVEIVRWEKERSDFKITSEHLASLRARHKQLLDIQVKIETNVRKHMKELDFYGHNDSCPTCQQAIDDLFKANIIKDRTGKVETANQGLVKLTDEIDRGLKTMGEDLKVLEQDKVLSDKTIHNQSRILSLTETVQEIEVSKHKLLNSDQLTLDNTQALEDTERKVNLLEKEKERLLIDRQYLEVAITLLKDGGIKTKIVKKYLPIINKLINKYLAQLEFFVDFNINESFEETIKSRFRDEFSYHNFSEGEKTRIDLAILLTWRAIAKMKNSVNTNLLILDEIFDSGLDGNGVDDFLKIMQTLTHDTNTFIISHRENLNDKFDHEYSFVKKGNFSTMIDTDKPEI